MNPPVFVFGSNLAGRHGAGAALEAVKHWGAIYGRRFGIQGNSYGIPTKDINLKTLSLEDIQEHVKIFIDYATNHKDKLFILTPIGCGLAGYKPNQIAQMFYYAPNNVYIPKEFVPYLQGPLP